MGSQEWSDTIFLKYEIEPPEIPNSCEGCGAGFSICHNLDYNKVKLVTTFHNEFRDQVVDLAGKYFNPSNVHTKPPPPPRL